VDSNAIARPGCGKRSNDANRGPIQEKTHEIIRRPSSCRLPFAFFAANRLRRRRRFVFHSADYEDDPHHRLGDSGGGSGGGSGVGNADGGSGPSSIVGGAVGSGIGGSGVDGSVRIYGGGTSKGVATGGTNGVVTTPSLDNISTVVTPPIRNVTPDASQKDNTPWGNDTDNANKQLAMAAVMIVTAAGLAVMSRLPGMGFLMGIAVAMAMAAAAMGASVSGTGSNLKNQYGQKAVGSSYEAAGAMTTAGAMGAMSGQSTQLMSSVMAMASPVIATIGTLTQASDSTGTDGQAATPPASSFALDVDTGTTGAVIGGLTR